jgi:hypothetical protein
MEYTNPVNVVKGITVRKFNAVWVFNPHILLLTDDGDGFGISGDVSLNEREER